MRAAAGALALLLLVPGPAAAQDWPDGGDEVWLEERLVDPLDLRVAGVDELARLPWLDLHLARAIVGLRELGALATLDDLLQVPGLDGERLDALRPFVLLPPVAAAGSPGWARVATASATTAERPPDARGSAWLEHGPWRGALRLRRRDPVSGWVRWAGDRGAGVWMGDLAPVAAAPLAWSGGPASSRTGRVSPHSPDRPRGRSTAPKAGGWRGVAAMLPVGPLELGGARRLAGVGPAGWLQLRVPTAAGGFGVAAATGGRAGLWWAASGLRLDLGWGGGPARAAGRWRRRHGAWTLGLAATTAPGGGDGVDPVAGQPLDRPHHAWQLDLAAAPAGWRGELLCRRVWRGHAGEPVGGRQRVQLRLRSTLFPATARVRLDEGLGEGGAPELSSRWELGPFGPRGLEWRLALRRASASGPAPELWSCSVDGPAGGGGWQLRAALARGTGSQPWGVGAGGAGPMVQWLRPGEVGLGGRWRAAGRGLELLAWTGLAGGGERPARAWGGLSLRWTGRWCEGC